MLPPRSLQTASTYRPGYFDLDPDLRFAANFQNRPFLSPAFRPEKQWSLGRPRTVLNAVTLRKYPRCALAQAWAASGTPRPSLFENLVERVLGDVSMRDVYGGKIKVQAL